jgi:CBS domain-containing protein
MTTSVQTKPLISMRSDASVKEAAHLMSDCSISALGVLDADRRFAGLITERDLCWFVARGGDPHETKLEKIANDLPLVVQGPMEDEAALAQMRRSRVRHLIVQQGDDLRIVSMRDYLFKAAEANLVARDLMTSPAVACRGLAFFEEVAEILAERDISGMPVVDDDGSVIGVISERDLAYALGGPMVRLALRRHNDKPLHGVTDLPRGARRARDIMTSPALTITLDVPLEEIALMMRSHQVNRLPVLDDGNLLGVVTRGDVLAALAHLEHPTVDLTRAPVLVGSAGLHPGALA